MTEKSVLTEDEREKIARSIIQRMDNDGYYTTDDINLIAGFLKKHEEKVLAKVREKGWIHFTKDELIHLAGSRYGLGCGEKCPYPKTCIPCKIWRKAKKELGDLK